MLTTFLNNKTITLKLLVVTFLFQSLLLAGAFQSLTLKAAAKGDTVIQICSGSGLKWIDVKDTNNQDHPSHSSTHCPLCSVSAFTKSDIQLPMASAKPLVLSQESQSPSPFIKLNPYHLPPSQGPPV